MADQPPIQGPMVHIECPGMHFDDSSPCVYFEAGRGRYDNMNSLIEFCMA